MDERFLQRMKDMLQDEYADWEHTLEEPRKQAIRINPHKCTPAIQEQLHPFVDTLKPAPFAKDQYYIQEPLGLTPLWLTGLAYMQEPSAAAPVDILDIQPDDRVLDLCAAPGSKSTQITEHLETGLLVANEVNPKRAAILAANLERTGYENAIVTNMETEDLCSQLPGFFDKVLVDAPCSGEGMMKKHEAAKEQWSPDKIQKCASLQRQILEQGVKALAPGGTLVYSTCTYAREENEDQVKWMLETFPELELVPIDKPYGRPDLDNLGALRIWPMDGGEGHFVSRFQKTGSHQPPQIPDKTEKLTKTENAFVNEAMPEPFAYWKHHNSTLYGMNLPFLPLRGKVIRQGIRIGEEKKNRFEPAHALYMSRTMTNATHKTDLDISGLDAFLHGNQIPAKTVPGWTAVCWNGLPVGFAKSTGTALNNKLPKGLRLLEGSHVHEA